MARPTTQTARLTAPPPLSRRSLSRRIVTLAALFAFVLYGLVVQTHVHPAAPQFSGPVASSQSIPGPLNSPTPDQGNCRLCQEIMHAGAYITPVAVLLPTIQVVTIAAAQPDPAARPWSRPALGWQSRAPPRN